MKIASRNLKLFLATSALYTALFAQTAPVSSLDPRVPTLTRLAKRAKEQGKTEIVFSRSAGNLDAFSTGLASALVDYSAIVGIPRATQVIAEEDQSISTWYSVDIEEVLMRRQAAMESVLLLDSLPPSLRPGSLLPLAPLRMLLLRAGGSMRVDGVKVTQREDDISMLKLGQRYLFIVEYSHDRIGRLTFGDAGVFSVVGDQDRLVPITGKSHPITDDVRSGRFAKLGEVRRQATIVR